MKKHILTVLAAAAALFAGCNKSELAPEVQGPRVVKISAALEATKVTTGSQIGKYTWEEGDVIGVWTGAEFTPFTLDADCAGNCLGTFTGNLPEGGAITESSHAIYPYYRDEWTEDDGVHVNESTFDGDKTIDAIFTDGWWSGYKPYVPLYGKPSSDTGTASTVSYKFSHVAAMVYVTLKNVPAEAVTIYIESNKEILLGGGKIDTSAEYPKITEPTAWGQFFLDLPENHGVIEEMSFYVPIMTGNWTDPKFRVNTFDEKSWGASMNNAADWNKYGYLNTAGVINRGDLFVLPAIEFPDYVAPATE